MLVLWIFLLGSTTLHLVSGSSKGPKETTEMGQLFKNFMDGNAYYHKFVEGVKKITGGMKGSGSGSSGDTHKSDSAGKEPGAPAPPTPPLCGKVFAFFGKAYGCQRAKIYKEFLINYKNNETFPHDEKDDVWLVKITETADQIETDKDESIANADATAKIKGLSEAQQKVLSDGEAAMPTAAQMYLRFIKAIGCSDSSEDKFKSFKSVLDNDTAEFKKLEKPISEEMWLAYTTIAVQKVQ